MVDATRLPSEMKAVVTTGNGGYDRLEYRDVPVPEPAEGEVLLRVLAAGVNNTDINTRLGWYSSGVTTDTRASATAQDQGAHPVEDGGWSGATPFPLIQGTDCCGQVVQIGEGVTDLALGARVLVRACMRPNGFSRKDMVWMGSDFDGAFAEYVAVPARDVFPVDCGWRDEELATIPCAYGTAENMLHRGAVAPGDTVLVTGASGGVGSATVQLAKRRGARVLAVTTGAKAGALRNLGAEVVIRGQDLIAALGENSVDVVVDNVAGPAFARMLKLLRPGGRYLSSGAIAGPIVSLDMRDMYLKDISLIGCTAWDEPVFPALISCIERGEIRPLLAGVYPLSQIAAAQAAFLNKAHIGNFVLLPG